MNQESDNIKYWNFRRKAAAVLDIIEGTTTAADLALAHDLNINEIEQWIRDFVSKGSKVLSSHSCYAKDCDKNLDFSGSYPGQECSIKIAKDVFIDFCWIPAGKFVMGSPEDEIGRDPDELQHSVKLSKGFWMAKTVVTRAQWLELMGNYPLSLGEAHIWNKAEVYKAYLQESKENMWPVSGASYDDAEKFLIKANAGGLLPDGWEMTLPTEAQWEYACRANTKNAINSGKELTSTVQSCPNLDEVAWYRDSHNGLRPPPVAGKKPNAWGLHDMHGGVYEWCSDWYGEYPSVPQLDPAGSALPTDDEDSHVIRGGTCNSHPSECRSAARAKYPWGLRCLLKIGIRPILQAS